jgi:hypothetical protein
MPDRGARLAYGEPHALTAYEQLIDRIVALAEHWGEVDVADDEDGLRMQLTPVRGLRTFLSVKRNPGALFSTLYKVECTTLVGTVDLANDEFVEFLDAANATTFGGAWEVFSNGDIGVTGQLLLADPSSQRLPELVAQLLALQVEDALAVGAPSGAAGFEEFQPPALPPVQLTFHRELDLDDITAALRWRSAHHDSHRWIVESVEEDQATLLAPRLVTDPVYSGEVFSGDAELLPDLRRVTIATTSHPRRGPGILLQVTLRYDAQADALAYRNWGIVTQSARWYGTGLGGLMLWGGDGPTELVYRAFLPLDFLGILDEPEAIDLVVDAALGGVNITGVAEAIIDAIANSGDEEHIDPAILDRQQELGRRYGLAALRAATHVRSRQDGLADVDGPLVDMGHAVLDCLALDQLQIATAPVLLWDRGFAWLPGPHVQRVTATPMRASRHHEVTEVSVTTDLGTAAAHDQTTVRRVCVELMDNLPLCSLLLTDDGQVQITSTVLVHEGVWWHRAGLVAVMAAMQLNCADTVRAALEWEGIVTDPTSTLRDRLLAQGPVEGFDPIYQVIPELRTSAAIPPESITDLLGIIKARLLERPFSHIFGAIDAEPDVLVLLEDANDDAGWDPPLGQAMVVLKRIDHEVAGDSLKVTVHPGFSPGGSDLVDEAMRLTAFTHATGCVSLCPSWTITGPTVSATTVLPRMAITTSGLDKAAEIAIQAVDSCLHALARAVTSSPAVFPGFDRSQINLTRADADSASGHADAPTVAWAPVANHRVLAFPQPRGSLERWRDIDLSHDAANALAEWLTAADNSLLFEHRGTELTAARRASEVVLHLAGQDLVLDEKTAQVVSDQLDHPEGPATGRVSGPIVTYPIGHSVDDDGHTVLVVPPAGALVAILGADDVVCDGVRAVTTTSLWVRFRAGTGEFNLNISDDLALEVLDGAGADGTISIVVAFPAVDGRVATPPPSPWHGEIPAPMIMAALDEINIIRTKA